MSDKKLTFRRKKLLIYVRFEYLDYLLMTETPHNLLQKSTPVYTDPVFTEGKML